MAHLARISAVVLVVAATPPAFAHPVIVDGDPSEWSTASPATADRSIVVRAASGGELIWWDASGDHRTDFMPAGPVADLTRLQVTGNASGLYLLIKTAATAWGSDPAPQFQVAFDTVPGLERGTPYFFGAAESTETTVSSAALWERLLVTHFGSGADPLARVYLFDGWFYESGTAWLFVLDDVIEIGIPWSSLGLDGPPSTPIRLTVATFLTDHDDVALDIATYSDAIDAVTDYATAPWSPFPYNTWDEVSDGVVDFSLQLWLDAQGDAYDPLAGTPCHADADCDDGNVCNGVETCGADLYCDAGIPLACDDGMFCNGAESCSALTGCVAGSAVICSDSNACTIDTCDEGSDSCAYSPAVGLPCDLDSNLCTADYCGGDLTCTAGPLVNCDDGSACTLDACSPATGACVNAAVTAGTPCSDANACTGPDGCDADGHCLPGPAVDCGDGNPCTSDSCDAATGACEHLALADATACPDGDACDGTERCTSGNCVEGEPLDCDDADACTAESCDPATGCAHTPIACDDGNACNGVETCDPTTGCRPGTPLACDDGNACTDDACDASAGCTYLNDDANTCSDGNTCTTGDACSSGVCEGTAPLTCSDGNPCTSDACLPATGCAFTALAAGTPCPDGDACNGAETCNEAASCLAGTPLDCDDGEGCTADSCAAATGCVHVAQTGASCADGDRCDGDETCSAAGACAAGTPLDCDDVNACTAESCDPATGCANTPIDCADSDACTADSCDPATGCAHATVSCDDADACTADACDPATGCAHAAVSCDDADACTADACDPATGCAHAAVSCDDANECTADACDPATGCASAAVADGTTCTGDGCTAGATCQAGSCTCTAPDEPSDSGGCSCGQPGEGSPAFALLLLAGLALGPRRRGSQAAAREPNERS